MKASQKMRFICLPEFSGTCGARSKMIAKNYAVMKQNSKTNNLRTTHDSDEAWPSSTIHLAYGLT